MFTPHQYFTFINTEEDAAQYIVPSGTTVLLICRNAPYFFIKSSDSLGQYTTDRYEFKKAPRTQTTPLPDNVVTKEQFDQFREEIRSLLTAQQPHPKEDITNATK